MVTLKMKGASMFTRNAIAKWDGNLKNGNGILRTGSGFFEGAYSFSSRFENNQSGTNPEELIAAAYASCFSQALSHDLDLAGYTPKRVKTNAEISLEKGKDGFKITKIKLNMEGEVPDIDEGIFHEHAERAKNECPVSKALFGVEKILQAKLIK
jgi:osmotically inducible protein OsmC